MSTHNTIKLSTFDRLFIIDLLRDELERLSKKECGFEDDFIDNKNQIDLVKGIINNLARQHNDGSQKGE